jgi:hypothetical protein
MGDLSSTLQELVRVWESGAKTLDWGFSFSDTNKYNLTKWPMKSQIYISPSPNYYAAPKRPFKHKPKGNWQLPIQIMNQTMYWNSLRATAVCTGPKTKSINDILFSYFMS